METEALELLRVGVVLGIQTNGVCRDTDLGVSRKDLAVFQDEILGYDALVGDWDSISGSQRVGCADDELSSSGLKR